MHCIQIRYCPYRYMGSGLDFQVRYYCSFIHDSAWSGRAEFDRYEDAIEFAKAKSAQHGLPIENHAEKELKQKKKKK